MEPKFDFERQSIQRAIDKASHTDLFDCSHVDVDELTELLWQEGYTIVPRTVAGAAGWTPAEFRAFQIGVMYERDRVREQIPTKGATPSD